MGFDRKLRPIGISRDARLEDHRLYPGCRLTLTCAACAWTRSYDPERVIRRLQALKTIAHRARLTEVAARVGWNCPGCRRMRWKAGFGWPVDLTDAEIRRLTNLYRN